MKIVIDTEDLVFADGKYYVYVFFDVKKGSKTTPRIESSKYISLKNLRYSDFSFRILKNRLI